MSGSGSLMRIAGGDDKEDSDDDIDTIEESALVTGAFNTNAATVESKATEHKIFQKRRKNKHLESSPVFAMDAAELGTERMITE